MSTCSSCEKAAALFDAICKAVDGVRPVFGEGSRALEVDIIDLRQRIAGHYKGLGPGLNTGAFEHALSRGLKEIGIVPIFQGQSNPAPAKETREVPDSKPCEFCRWPTRYDGKRVFNLDGAAHSCEDTPGYSAYKSADPIPAPAKETREGCRACGARSGDGEFKDGNGHFLVNDEPCPESQTAPADPAVPDLPEGYAVSDGPWMPDRGGYAVTWNGTRGFDVRYRHLGLREGEAWLRPRPVNVGNIIAAVHAIANGVPWETLAHAVRRALAAQGIGGRETDAKGGG